MTMDVTYQMISTAHLFLFTWKKNSWLYEAHGRREVGKNICFGPPTIVGKLCWNCCSSLDYSHNFYYAQENNGIFKF